MTTVHFKVKCLKEGVMSGNVPALTTFQLLLTTPNISFPDPNMRCQMAH